MAEDNIEQLYEDALCYVILAEKPAALGHIQVYPQKDFKTLEDMDDELVQHMFFVASYAATALFEGLKAQGTNIIVNNGVGSGQKHEKVCIDVVARNDKDNLDMMWKPKKADPAKLEEAFKRIKGDAFYVGKEANKKEEKVVNTKKPAKINSKGENYLIKHLNRVP